MSDFPQNDLFSAFYFTHCSQKGAFGRSRKAKLVAPHLFPKLENTNSKARKSIVDIMASKM